MNHAELWKWTWDQPNPRAGWWLRNSDGGAVLYVTKLGSTEEGRAEVLRACNNFEVLVEAVKAARAICKDDVVLARLDAALRKTP